MKRKPKIKQSVPCFQWWVTFEDGSAYWVPDHSEWSLKRKLYKYFPHKYISCLTEEEYFEKRKRTMDYNKT